MICTIYSIQDSKTGIFCRPFIMQTEAAAMRDFAHAANSPDNDVGRYPTDFTIFRLGSFDDLTGRITVEPSPVALALASSLVRPSEV